MRTLLLSLSEIETRDPTYGSRIDNLQMTYISETYLLYSGETRFITCADK